MTTLTTIPCPNCGKAMVVKSEFDGVWCTNPECIRLGRDWLDREPKPSEIVSSPSDIFSEERTKHLRGVPVQSMTIGSETKGRIVVQIPCSATKEESKFLIDCALDNMQYLKEQIISRGLDIYTSRGKKENSE